MNNDSICYLLRFLGDEEFPRQTVVAWYAAIRFIPDIMTRFVQANRLEIVCWSLFHVCLQAGYRREEGWTRGIGPICVAVTPEERVEEVGPILGGGEFLSYVTRDFHSILRERESQEIRWIEDASIQQLVDLRSDR